MRTTGPVYYFKTEAERARYRLEVRDGKFYDAKGELFDTTKARSPHPNNDGHAIFVMDEDGEFYASNYHAPGLFQHSTFFGGTPVAGAGEFRMVEGVLKKVTRRAGHYKISPEFAKNVESRLKELGVDLSTTIFV